MNYDEFRKKYEKEHPASVPKIEYETSDHPGWLMWAVAAMFLASALLSGVHTVPTAYDTIEILKVAEPVRQAGGLASFVFVELGILVSSYMLFKNRSFWVSLILLLAVMIAVAANLYSVSNALKVNGDNIGMSVVAIALGIGAPLIATMSGKVLVALHRSDRIIDSRARQKLKEDNIAWDKEIIRAWKQYVKNDQTADRQAQTDRQILDRLQMEPVYLDRQQTIDRQVVSMQTDNRQTVDRQDDYLSIDKTHYSDTDRQTTYMSTGYRQDTDRRDNYMSTDNRQDMSMQTGYGYERNSSAVNAALEYMKTHPNTNSMSVREIGEAAGVGKDSAAKARRIYQQTPSTIGDRLAPVDD